MSQVINERQVFTQTGPEMIEFSHVQVLFFQDGQYFLGCRRQRKKPTIGTDELYDVTRIPSTDYQPLLPPKTMILRRTDTSVYIKRPNLNNYSSTSSLSANLIREIRVCEMLLQNPHRNIATYLGCTPSGDRVDGIAFQRYPQSLMTLLNPTSLNKKDFLSNRQLSLETAELYLGGIKAGIEHLHGLGFIHNDINPMNIMISEENIAVIIDFESCVKVGESLELIKRTHGWHDWNETIAREDNDLDALKEIRTWLTGTSANEFQYLI
ncbi:hypothetical protein QQS21_002101 [Conoideocrella luteorostrata]|uniref:Protein kinase domain-containing protein n=1 Tax=Conoideocrella luteorostrata TaxID=1105319 RepID=A0AAJ0G1F4_9HYPO|nr:hypothetical protein QQS21_002101 [Conoideocrella luteorostrata]